MQRWVSSTHPVTDEVAMASHIEHEQSEAPSIGRCPVGHRVDGQDDRLVVEPWITRLDRLREHPGLTGASWGGDDLALEAERLGKDPAGRGPLTPARGGVAIDEATLRLGKESFYGETFGNEFFLSDVVGMLGGPVRPSRVVAALVR